MKHRHSLFILLLTTLCVSAHAPMHTDTVQINFRQSKVSLDTAYMDNARAIDHARKAISAFHNPDSGFVLTGVTVVGAASPEGSVRFNQWLSRQRAERIFDYIGSMVALPDSITDFTFVGRDWTGLRQMVLADPAVPYRDDVLATLDRIIERDSVGGGELESYGNIALLKSLHGGEPYIYMYHRLFPSLRVSRLVLTFASPRMPYHPTALMPLVEFVPAPMPLVLAQAPTPRAPRPFYMGLKTNMLFDALALPNIGAEFYLGRNLTVVGNWMYGWWKSDPKSTYWRAYGGDIAVRWWFGSKAHAKPMTGHHVGVYGGVVTYDFELGGRGYMGGLPGHSLWDRCNWYTGIEYGYSLPVSRRLNIDFTLGLGYLAGEYRVYDPVDNCYVWRATKYRRWYGPTKAEVSLVWLIGRGNYNDKSARPRLKGGAL